MQYCELNPYQTQENLYRRAAWAKNPQEMKLHSYCCSWNNSFYYVFLKSFLHQNGRSCAKLKAVSSCQAWAQRGEENTTDRTWSIVGSSGTAPTTQTNVFKTKKTGWKAKHRQSWVHSKGEGAAHLLFCHSPVLPRAIFWVQNGQWLSTGMSCGH